jgi:opacity protein-like surface antigen
MTVVNIVFYLRKLVMKSLRNWTTIISASLVFLLSSAAIAKEDKTADWYFAGAGGMAISFDSDITVKENSGTIEGTGDYDVNNGFVFTGAMGKKFGDFRIEAELSYRENDLNTLAVTSATVAGSTFLVNASADMDGDHSSLGGMVNGIYEFKNDSRILSDFTPFILAGVGFSRQTLDVNSIAGVSVSYDESDIVMAYQFGAGVSYPVTENAQITGQWRYFGTADPDFDDGTIQVDGEYSSHALMIGFTRSF